LSLLAVAKARRDPRAGCEGVVLTCSNKLSGVFAPNPVPGAGAGAVEKRLPPGDSFFSVAVAPPSPPPNNVAPEVLVTAGVNWLRNHPYILDEMFFGGDKLKPILLVADELITVRSKMFHFLLYCIVNGIFQYHCHCTSGAGIVETIINGRQKQIFHTIQKVVSDCLPICRLFFEESFQ
jgi:hypothetical protein